MGVRIHRNAHYPAKVIYDGGHRRWGIENKAFNELTQFYHLEHCYHHEPAAMLAQMLILMDLALEEDLPWDLWFACG